MERVWRSDWTHVPSSLSYSRLLTLATTNGCCGLPRCCHLTASPDSFLRCKLLFGQTAVLYQARTLEVPQDQLARAIEHIIRTASVSSLRLVSTERRLLRAVYHVELTGLSPQSSELTPCLLLGRTQEPPSILSSHPTSPIRQSEQPLKAKVRLQKRSGLIC